MLGKEAVHRPRQRGLGIAQQAASEGDAHQQADHALADGAQVVQGLGIERHRAREPDATGLVGAGEVGLGQHLVTAADEHAVGVAAVGGCVLQQGAQAVVGATDRGGGRGGSGRQGPGGGDPEQALAAGGACWLMAPSWRGPLIPGGRPARRVGLME